MTSDWQWVLAAAAVLVVVLVTLLIWQWSRIRQLRSRIAELRHRMEVGASLAAHPKKPSDRLVGVVLNVSKESADRAVELIETACRQADMPEPLILATTAEDPGHLMARTALDAGCDVVLAAGGDGTVRAVATELVGREISLGVVPLGTGNLFARNIGLPYSDLEACVREALHGIRHRVDTLNLTLERSGGKTQDEVSLVIAGAGLDAEVMANTRDVLKQRAGWLAYGEAGVRHMLGPRRTVTVSLDDRSPDTFKVRSVLLANCGLLQAGVVLVPSARFDDGHMDTVLLTPRHALDWARILTKTVLRISTEIPVMRVRQARSGRITMAEPTPFQIDGDAVGEVVSVSAVVDHQALIVNGVVSDVLETAVSQHQSSALQ